MSIDGMGFHYMASLAFSGLVMVTGADLLPDPKLETYFQVKSLSAERINSTAVFTVDREIYRPIEMSFVVRVLEFTDEGLEQFCKANSQPFMYHPQAKNPTGKDLAWWTDGQCPVLPPGDAFISTTWTPVDKRLSPLTVEIEVK